MKLKFCDAQVQVLGISWLNISFSYMKYSLEYFVKSMSYPNWGAHFYRIN